MLNPRVLQLRLVAVLWKADEGINARSSLGSKIRSSLQVDIVGRGMLVLLCRCRKVQPV